MGPWIPDIRNHFWFCCANCEGSELKLKLIWTRLLHHISNDHDYCEHGELSDEDHQKPYLLAHGNTMKKLREIVLDPQWLKSLAYYTRNRHTGMLEVKIILLTAYKGEWRRYCIRQLAVS